MADVDIEVDSGDLKAAIDLLGNLGDKFVKTVTQMESANKRLERASKSSSDVIDRAFDKVVGDALQSDINKARGFWAQYEQSLGVTGRRATELGATFGKLGDILEREAKQSKAYWDDFNKSLGIGSNATGAGAGFAALEKEIQKLTQKYAPLTAAAQQYEKEVQDISRAHQLGLTSAAQYQNQLKQLEVEYNALQKGTYLAGSRFNQFGQMADGAGKSANRFGMYAQQAGYQLGDFAVQIQSGTNVGVAFSQQFAQLAGLIPGVYGALATFSAIGLGLLIQNLTRGEKKAEDFKKIVSDFDSFSPIFESVASDLDRSLGGALDRVREKYGTLVSEMAEMRRKAAIDSLLQGLEKAVPRASVTNPTGNARQGWGQNVLNQMFADNGGLDVLADQAKEANVVIDDLRNKIKELGSDTTLTTEQMLSRFKEWTDEVLNSTTYTDQQKEAIKAFVDVSGLDLEIAKQKTEEIRKQVEEQTRLQRLYESEQQNNFDNIRTLEQKAELQKVGSKYGEDSLNYLKLEGEQNLLNYQIDLQRQGIRGEELRVLLEQRKAQIDIEIAQKATVTQASVLLGVLESISGVDISGVFSRAQAAASGLLGTVNAIGRAMSKVGQLGMEAEALKAQRNALANGATPGEAKVAGDVVRFGQTLPQGYGIAGDVVRGMIKKTYENQSLENLRYEDEIATSTKAYNDANKPSKGGRKGGKSDAEKAAEKEEKRLEKINEKFVDFINNHALYIEQQERLVGVFGEAREKEEKIIDIERRLGDARVIATDQQIEAWAEAELAIERLRKTQDEVFNTLSGSFENFLMDVVNGTSSIEEAFKSMLSNIIAEIYQSQVAKPAADWAGNFIMGLFSANGNAFGTGGVKMFANGGVVNGPTPFKYSGGLGVMGEAGPEAIMPLKRNSQGKLGVAVEGKSSGNVSINQVFQISANGDESVKAIIEQQLPMIRKAAVEGVIAEKRRGRNGL